MTYVDLRNKPAKGTTGGTQAPPQSAPVQQPVVNYFESFNKQNEQRQRQLLGMPPAVQAPQIDTPTAGQGYQQAFPRPKDTLQQNANKVAPVPQTEQPKKQYLFERAATPVYAQTPKKGINPDDYRDGTSDGLGRNFLSKTFVPKTEEDYSRENETAKRILALGDALRHIGNIVNTSNGGPVQTFNDPVGMAEGWYQKRKADRVAERTRKEAAAYKQAQIDYQQQKMEGDRDYKNFLLQLKLGQAKTAAERNKALDDFRKEQQKWREQNAADQFAYRQQKDKEDRAFRQQVHADQMASQAENRALRREIHNSSSSGGGSTKIRPIIPTRTGHMARKNPLNTQDLLDMWNDMDSMGMLTDAKKKEVRDAFAIDKAVGYNKIRNAIWWGTQHSPQWRAKLMKSYGFTEVGREPQHTTAAASGGANPGTEEGNRHQGVNSAFGKK